MSIEVPTTPEISRLNFGRQIINFMGPEGSGKTSIAQRLASESGKPRLVYGDIFRDLATNDPGPHGDECREVFKEHRYIKPEILFEIMVDRFKREDLANGFILDGAMRTVGEVESFQPMLEQSGRSMPFTNVFLRIPGWMGAGRIQRADRNRADDDTDAVISRLSNFYKNLGQRTSFIESQKDWKLLLVNGVGDLEEVYQRVVKILSQHKVKDVKLNPKKPIKIYPQTSSNGIVDISKDPKKPYLVDLSVIGF
jgi:adenylate kinase